MSEGYTFRRSVSEKHWFLHYAALSVLGISLTFEPSTNPIEVDAAAAALSAVVGTEESVAAAKTAEAAQSVCARMIEKAEAISAPATSTRARWKRS